MPALATAARKIGEVHFASAAMLPRPASAARRSSGEPAFFRASAGTKSPSGFAASSSVVQLPEKRPLWLRLCRVRN